MSSCLYRDNLPRRHPRTVGIDCDEILWLESLQELDINLADVLDQTVLEEDVSLEDLETIDPSGPDGGILRHAFVQPH